MRQEGPSKALDWTNLALGAGLAYTSTIFSATFASWSAGIIGTLVIGCSNLVLCRSNLWPEYSNIILGCAAMATPFLFGFADPWATWTHALIGFGITIFAGKQLMLQRDAVGGIALL